MAQGLRALALAKDPGSSPSTYTSSSQTSITSVQRDMKPVSDHCRHRAHMVHRLGYMFKQDTNTHKIIVVIIMIRRISF